MKNKIGMILFGIGFAGVCLGGCGLDSPGNGWKISLGIAGVSILIGAIGYLLMDVDEVLNGAGLTRTKESKEVAARKQKNRERTWEAWVSTVNWR